MKKNIHPIERGLRFAIGVFLISLAFWGPRNPWYFLGIIPVLTSLSGWCPMYTMLGISTCKVHKDKKLV